MDINLSSKTLSMCLKYVNDIGSQTIMNICDGTKHVVPWGAMDWMFGLMFGSMFAIIAGLFAACLIGIGIEMFRTSPYAMVEQIKVSKKNG